jgi:hypothetical protein
VALAKAQGKYSVNVLVACEKSGVVRRAFRALGHNAWSCDLEPSDDKSPYHFTGDALVAIRCLVKGQKWDLLIGHPPCTYLSVSGALHFKKPGRMALQVAAFEFFMRLWFADIPRIALEQPVSVISTRFRKPDQIIQPWQFGHPENKKNVSMAKESASSEGHEERP